MELDVAVVLAAREGEVSRAKTLAGLKQQSRVNYRTVSDPGKARIYVRDPPVTVKCYGADVTVNSIFNCVG